MPTSTAARPTKLCSIATSSGIPVISTVRARQAPITPPAAIMTRISRRVTAKLRSSRSSAFWAASSRVASSARPMPTMPATLPSLAVSCFDRPARAPMKSSPAMM